MKNNIRTIIASNSTLTGLLVLAISLFVVRPLSAASDTWVGNNTANWNLAGNWSPAAIPAAADDLTFGAAGSSGTGLNNDIAAGTIFDSITFSNGAAAYTLAANGIVLTNGFNSTSSTAVTGGGVANNAGSSVNEIISLPLTLSAGNHTISTGAGSGSSSFSGAFMRNANATVQFTKSGGNINYTSSGLANVNSIIGGYAVIGLGVNAGNWAALDGSQNVVANATYVTKASNANFGLSSSGGNAASNIEITSRPNSTAGTINGTTTGTYDINTLLWNQGGTPGGDITLNIASGQILRLGANGGIMTVHADNRTFNVGNSVSSSAITAGGAANTAGELSLYAVSFANGSARLQIKAPITDNGSGAVSVNTLGDVQFTMANTYSGGTYVNIGRVWANNTAGLGSGAVTVYPGGEVALNNSSSGTYGNNFFIAGYGSSGIADPMAIRQANAFATLSGTITLSGTATIGINGNSLTTSGNITGPGGLYVIGSYANGSLHLDESSANTYAGDTTIDAAGLGNDTSHGITIWIFQLADDEQTCAARGQGAE